MEQVKQAWALAKAHKKISIAAAVVIVSDRDRILKYVRCKLAQRFFQILAKLLFQQFLPQPPLSRPFKRADPPSCRALLKGLLPLPRSF